MRHPPAHAVDRLPWRYLLVDVDGTLLDSRGRISPRNLAALHLAWSAGMQLVLATGRTYASLMRVCQGMGLPPFHLITNGGAVGLTPGGAAVRYTHFLDPALWPQVVQALQAEELAALVFSHRHPDPPLVYIAGLEGGPHFEAYVERNLHLCRLTPGLAEAAIPDVVEVAALGRGPAFDDAAARVLRRFAEQTRNHAMVLALGGNPGKIAEFFQPGTSKWRAFLGLFPDAAAHPQRVIAIGDEANDVEMITQAGLGIAMGNATPALKAVAGRVTGHHDADGLAEALERLLS